MKILPFKIPHSGDGAILLQTDRQPYFYDALHQHPEIQISWIVESTGTLFLGDYIGGFQPGDVFVIGSNIPHVFKNDTAYYENTPGLEAHMHTIFLRPAAFGKDFLRLPEAQQLDHFIRLSQRGIGISETASTHLIPLLKAIQQQEGLDMLITFFQLVRTILQTADSQLLSSQVVDYDVNESDGHRLNAVIRFTLDEYHRPIALEEVAAIANLSPPAFCRFFKKRTRKSYINFVNEIRISKACKLLLDKDLSVSEISYRSGFNSISHFNRKFRALLGVTPSEYHKVHEV